MFLRTAFQRLGLVKKSSFIIIIKLAFAKKKKKNDIAVANELIKYLQRNCKSD